MILNRYLIREISLPFIAVTFGLAFIFASYAATVYLAEAASGQLATGCLGQVISALQAGGFSRARLLVPLLRVTLLVAILAGLLAAFGRPWAYQKIYTLESQAQEQLDVTRIDPRRFQSSPDGKFVIYADSIGSQAHSLNDVFVSFKQNDNRLIVRAQRLSQTAQENAPPVLHFYKGHLYRMDQDGGRDEILHFQQFDYKPAPSDRIVGYKRKAASTADLLMATDSDDIAERQWRLSRPFATLFLALLGIGFARSSPRRGRGANTFAAAIGFALYYNLAGIARSWVEQGNVPPVPGVYWLDALVGIIALAFLFRPGLRHY